ncbi:MAG: hypothetical protein IPJ42_21780 [Betaproteobacteria bacterium]|nr:hypothetical protein [Betaproteobacteria bacterium]
MRKKDLDAVGIRVEFKTAKWPENLKADRSGKLQIWALARGQRRRRPGPITRYFGPQAGKPEYRAFRLPALDALHERLTVLPDARAAAAVRAGQEDRRAPTCPTAVHAPPVADR